MKKTKENFWHQIGDIWDKDKQRKIERKKKLEQLPLSLRLQIREYLNRNISTASYLWILLAPLYIIFYGFVIIALLRIALSGFASYNSILSLLQVYASISSTVFRAWPLFIILWMGATLYQEYENLRRKKALNEAIDMELLRLSKKKKGFFHGK